MKMRFPSKELRRKLLGAILAMVLLVAASLGACALRSPAPEPSVPEEEAEVLSVYYLNREETGLVARDHIPESESASGRIEELLEALSEAPSADLIAPVGRLEIRETSFDNGQLILDLSTDFAEIDRITQVLIRAAVVRTLCQVNGVGSVLFTVGGEIPEGSSALMPENYVYNVGRDINSYERVRLILYFAGEDGTTLIRTARTVVYNSNIPLERLVVEEVLKGPNAENIYPTLNPDTKLISITSRDGIAYVNMDRSFLTQPYPVRPDVAVYSIVNSLTELPQIHKVQLSIDGDTSLTFQETMPLRTAYERNLELVESR